MSDDINEKVLAAYQAEHKEQLEGIRALLAELERSDSQNQPHQINEAFRLAHSLKGGARVCDLRPPETLAHRLETAFEQICTGTLCLDEKAARTINVVLDAIEDWMAALDRDERPDDPQEALTAIEQLINQENQAVRKIEISDHIKQRLLHAFCGEYPQYLAGLRQFATMLEEENGKIPADVLEETYRLAHNLRGSAQAAEIETIEDVSQALESLIGSFRDQTTRPDAQERKNLGKYLSTIDAELDRLLEASGLHASIAHLKHDDANLTPQPPPPALRKPFSSAAEKPVESARNADTVRISTESLDNLLRSSRQLMAESLGQEQVSRDLEGIQRQVQLMKRECESVRHLLATSLHRLTTLPEFPRLADYFDIVDRGLQSLERTTRQARTLQRRNSWLLQSRSRQIQQDVRSARMVPAEVVYQSLRKLVRDLAKAEGKQVEFRVSGFEVRADRMVFQSLKDPLIHMLRNCIVHGVESPEERIQVGKNGTSRVDLRIEAIGNRLSIEVEDDGRGIDRSRISNRALERGLVSPQDLAEYSAEEIEDLIFGSGFSTSEKITEVAGRGMGLCVVKETVKRLQGDVRIHQKESAGTKFHISVPLCVSTHRLLLVSADNQTYAIPMHGIERLLRVAPDGLELLEGKPVVSFQDQFVSVIPLASALGLPSMSLKTNGDALQLVVLKSGIRSVAVSVDAFLAERDALIQDLDRPAASETYLGAILLEDGNVALVLNPRELLEHPCSPTAQLSIESANPRCENRLPRVLVVDDSFTTRTLEKGILEANGYEVGIAVDGVEGLNKLKSEPYDLVISDVEMPRMDGFALLEHIKNDNRLSKIPVIMVTSRVRREDQEKGLDLGAEAYIMKQKFDHQSLLSTIRQIVGG